MRRNDRAARMISCKFIASGFVALLKSSFD
jgi:hypothetical protein